MAYPFNGKTVVLDIGHGKNTFPPSKGVYKDGVAYHEHDFNSKVAIELEKLLKHNGFKVVMYQKPFSNEVGLVQRTNYYKSINPDLVWSIHANAGNESADGRCSFYWYQDDDAKSLAYSFADEVRKAGYTTHGNGTHASQYNSWTNLHICRENYRNGITAVLTENGFMTNDLPGTDDDFELVFGSKQSQYVNDIAHIHAKVICKHFGINFHEIDSDTPNQPLYRVRKSWSDYKSQLGAFANLNGAKSVAEDNKGYRVFDENGRVVHDPHEKVQHVSNPVKPKPQPKPSKKKQPDMKTNSIVTYLNSIGEDSSYGNRAKLAVKYKIKNYKGTESQNLLLLSILRDGKKVTATKPKPKKSINQMAQEIIDNKHGNGHENRRKSLGISKSEYEKVRSEVNRILNGKSNPPKPKKTIAQMANEVILGKHGSGHENRRKSLGISKAEYEKVRTEVNRRL